MRNSDEGIIKLCVGVTPTQMVKFVRITRTNAGGRPDMVCLPLESLPGWLFGIDSSRVKAELREKVILYQAECFKILWQAFQTQALALTNQSSETIRIDPIEQALEQVKAHGQALIQLAEQQLADHRDLQAQKARLDKAAQIVGGIEKRLAVVEKALTPETLISNGQAEQIKARVKALAEYIMKLDPKKRLPFGAIYDELYRRFGVSDYQHIRRNQFEDVMNFLNDVREAAGAGRLPDQLSMFAE